MAFRSVASAGLLILALLAPAQTPRAQNASSPLRGAAVIDGQSLKLADGQVLRLAGIVAPDARRTEERQAAAQAKAALDALVRDRALVPATPDRRDRHGAMLSHVNDGDGRWVQGELLRAGLVRVWTRPDAPEKAAEMLALEAEARAAGRGLWALPYFAILTPETAAAGLDRFQIVEARVVEVARVRGTVYLNTAADWRSDFTARIERPALAAFAASGIELAALKDRRIRVRGWLRRYNGPFVDVTHPQQIEVLDP